MRNSITSFIVSAAVISLFMPVAVGATVDSSDLILQMQQQILSLQMQLNSLIAEQRSSDIASGRVLGAITFADGNSIKAVSRVNVRATPSTSGALLGTAPKNATGVLRCDLAGSTACPTTANGYTWWYVKWDSTSIPSGWSADAYFAPVIPAGVVTIAGISPTYGTPGFPVTISGTGFTATDNTVLFGSSTIAHLPSYDGTTLQTTVPTGAAPGSVKVSVTNANGASNQVSFKVTAPAPPPISVVLSSLDPSEIDAKADLAFTISGSGFTHNGNTVYIQEESSSYALPFSGSQVVYNSPSSITLTVGSPVYVDTDCWQPGTHRVMVKNANGASNFLPFVIRENPESPCTVGYSHFAVYPIPSSHLVGQVVSTDPAASTFILNVTASARVAGTSGIGMVTISPGAYTIQVTPTTKLVDESNSPMALDHVLAGVLATANGYMTSAGGNSRTINASQTTIQFGSEPKSKPGPGPKPATTANVGFLGTVTSVDAAHSSFQGLVSSVYYLSSSFAAAIISAGTTVNVIVPTGANLTDGCGAPITLAQVPLNAAFDANVSVNLVTNVIMASAIRFSIGSCTPTTHPPYIGSVVPSSGPAGSPVTLSGSGFTSINNTVHFGSIAIPNVGTQNNDPKSIRFTVPANAPIGATAVMVSNANGNSNTATFTVSAPGTINLLAPNGGEVWTAGTSNRITWNASTSIASVDIQLYKAGNSVAVIATAVPASQGYYYWTIPQSTVTGGDYTIVIFGSGSAMDASNAAFTITTESQSRNAFLSNIVLFSPSTPTGQVNVAATINGSPLTGALIVDFAGPSGSQTYMPVTLSSYTHMRIGDYVFTYKSGGPASATFQGIKVNGVNVGRTATQTLADGGSITFTFVFTSP